MNSFEELRPWGRDSVPRVRRSALIGLAGLLALATAVVRAQTLPLVDVDVPNGTTYPVAADLTIRMLTGSGTVSIAGGTTLTTNLPSDGTGSTATFSGVLTGSGTYNFVKDGPGYFTFTGTAGATDTLMLRVASGTFQLGDGGTTGSVTGHLAIDSPGTFVYNRSDDGSLPVVLTGQGTFEKQGAGNLTLNSTAGFAGTVRIDSGTFTVGNDNTLSSQAGVSVQSGGTFAVAGSTGTGATIGSLQGGGGTTIAAGKTLTIAGSSDSQYDGSISGDGSLVKSGFGSFTLTGTNTYTGGTTVSAGNLYLQAADPTTVISHASADLVVGNTPSNFVTVKATGGSGILDRNGVIASTGGSYGSVTIADAGSQWTNNADLQVGLLGSGSLFVCDGAVVSAVNTRLGINGGSLGNVTVEGAGSQLDSSQTLHVGESGTGWLTVNGGGTINVANGTGTVNLATSAGSNGTLTIGGSKKDDSTPPGVVNAATITTGAGNGTVVLDTDTTSAAPYYLTNDGTATGSAVTIQGNTQLINATGYNVVLGSQAYTGTTNLTGGTLVVGAVNALPTSTKVSFNPSNDSTPTLALDYNQTVGAITDTSSSDGGTTISLAAGTKLTLASSNGFSSLFAGSIVDRDDSGGGQLALSSTVTNKISNTLILTGTNTYTGGTVIGAGTSLVLGNGGSSGSIVGNVTDNGRLVFNRSDDFNFDGVISGTGSVWLGNTSQNSDGYLTLNGQSTYTGSTVINSGTLVIGTDNALPTGTTVVFNSASYSGTLAVDHDQTIAALSTNNSLGSYGIELGTGRTLTFNGSGRSSSFSGVIYGDGGLQVTAGTLTLNGTSSFSGGVKVQSGGALYLSGYYNNNGASTLATVNPTDSYGGPAGSGTIEIDGGLLGNTGYLHLDNDVVLGDGSTLASSGTNKDFDTTLTLTGTVTLSSPTTLLHLTGDGPVYFSGLLAGANAGTALTLDSGSSRFGGMVLAGTMDANVTQLVADHSAILFELADALPQTLSVNAVNHGYVGVVSGAFIESGNGATPALLLSHIADPASFAGTFGFDSDPQSKSVATFTDDIDFSAFTNPSFSIGSATNAVIEGHLTAPNNGTTGLYHFGGGPGVLLIDSSLTDTPLTSGSTTLLPTSVSVSSPSDLDPQYVIFRGANTYSGNLSIDHGAAVLDSEQALPSTASVTLGANSYLGYTEAAGFSSFADFASRIAPGAYTSTSILGLDSHDWIANALNYGSTNRSYYQWQMGDNIDLSSFNSIYLGTGTTVELSGRITAPSDGVLRLASVNSALLVIDSSLTSETNVNSLVIGLPTANSSAVPLQSGIVELRSDNTYSGGTTLNGGILALDHDTTVEDGVIQSGPIGTGVLTVAANSGDSLPTLASATSDARTLDNAIVLNGDLQVGVSSSTSNSDYSLPTGGLLALTGEISGAGGLVIDSDTILGSSHNTYTGGTFVENTGRVLFAAPGSLPSTGLLTAASFESYVGNNFSLSTFQTDFINRFDKTKSQGTIGLDSFQTDGIQTYSGNFDLTGFNSSARLGSATSAIISSSSVITPSGGTGSPYQFGGGGGWLEVDAPLTNAGSIFRGLSVTSPTDRPLTLRLTSAANTFTGSTNVWSSALIFAAGALPAGASNINVMSGSYAGTEDATLPVATYLAHFSTVSSDSIIGFDTAPGASSPLTINTNLDLSQFYAGAYSYIGTATSLVLGPDASLTLSPYSGGYRFAAYKGGSLQIDAQLTGAENQVVLGAPFVLATQLDPNSTDPKLSTITLNGANTYGGGTSLYAGKLLIGNDQALGTGTLSVLYNSFEYDNQGTSYSNRAPVLASAGGLHTLANQVWMNGNLTISGDLELAGSIYGYGEIYKIDRNTLTLSGHNSGFSGDIYVSAGNVTFTQDDSAGIGQLALGGPLAPSVTFTSSAPTIGGLSGDNSADALMLADNSTLTIRQSGDTQYNGSISGNNAGLILNAASDYAQLTLAGTDTYTGGTTINNGILVAGSSNALPATGTVLVNGGVLATAPGVTVAFDGVNRPLQFNSGTLAGYGTFALSSHLHIGATEGGSTSLFPGAPGSPGQLNFTFTEGTKLVFDSGGTYYWQLGNATNGWWSSVSVAGAVDVAATAAAPFSLVLTPAGAFDNTVNVTLARTSGGTYPTNFDVHSAYSWKILTADAITGFDPGKFTISLGQSFGAGVNDYNFSLSLGDNGTSLLLNFDPAAVPEPSTWALLLTGLGVVAIAAWRRRRA